LRNKRREHAAFIGLANARRHANYYELARAMRIRFFGSFAGVFIGRARPVPGCVAASAVDVSFFTAWLFVKACIFTLLLVSCCRAIFASRYFSAIFRYMSVFVAFEALANLQRGIIGFAFEYFSIPQ
jgi:hypothetical protein